jgi:hypothetical protein
MRPIKSFLFALVLFGFSYSAPVAAQTETFSDENVDYRFDLPSPTWKVVTRPDGLQKRAEFIYGDRLDGYLQIHKEIVEPGIDPSDLAASYKDDKLRFKPGYVDGKEESFVGHLSGVTMSYEYTYSGKSMVGRIYFLQVENRSIYVMHFTGLRDKLERIRNQTDSIARTFAVK